MSGQECLYSVLSTQYRVLSTHYSLLSTLDSLLPTPNFQLDFCKMRIESPLSLWERGRG